MTNNIVSVNVTQTVAPTPSQLQKTGALISQGGTSIAQGTKTLLTQASDLTAIAHAAADLASLTQSAGVATATLKSTTIASGTYDSGTGLVSLTLTADVGVGVGDPVTVANATGTGVVADIEGTYIAEAGSGGTTLNYTIATGLTLTISGGDVNASLDRATSSTFWTTIAGATQAGYNGKVLATVTGDDTFTYAVDSSTVSPATGTPTFTPPGVLELTQMVDTFFGQGAQQAVYVLELGPGTPADGVTYLETWIAANPGIFYAYLMPRAWGGESTFRTMLASYETTTSKTYFFTTVTLAQYSSFTAAMKCALLLVESPDVPDTEFSLAAVFQRALNYAPSSTNKVTPFAFGDLFGVTAYPTAGNSSTLAALKAAYVNYVGTGAEGGITNTILFWGTTMDGRDFTYWYSVDWSQINVDQALAATVINGSNNPSNPLYYNQDGINRLQAAAVQQMGNAITYGLALGTLVQTALSAADFQNAINEGTYAGQVVVNAEPFVSYTASNPNDYKAGKYGGISIAYTPARGFIQIVVNINVSDFVSG